jgi:hypothetical protein
MSRKEMIRLIYYLEYIEPTHYGYAGPGYFGCIVSPSVKKFREDRVNFLPRSSNSNNAIKHLYKCFNESTNQNQISISYNYFFYYMKSLVVSVKGESIEELIKNFLKRSKSLLGLPNEIKGPSITDRLKGYKKPNIEIKLEDLEENEKRMKDYG